SRASAPPARRARAAASRCCTSGPDTSRRPRPRSFGSWFSLRLRCAGRVRDGPFPSTPSRSRYSTMSTRIITREDAKAINEGLREKLATEDPALLKSAKDDMDDFIRLQVREDSFLPQLLPAEKIAP